MKIDIIKPSHIIDAAKLIDEIGVPDSSVRNHYYVLVNGEEYPFKYLVREAYKFATSGQELTAFQSQEKYRDYVSGLGFKINYYPENINFFTKAELDFYSNIANKDYRKNDSKCQHYRDKLNPILAKVNYWAEELSKAFPEFSIEKQSGWLGYKARISPYFWPKLYKEVDKDIFFNVEVNGEERFIGYKLDGYYGTANELTPSQQEVLNEFKSAGKWTWPRIDFDDLYAYNWNRLIEESSQYIKDLLEDYDHLKKLMSKELRIGRITWNTNGWIRPSGPEGKSKTFSFEKRNGYGFEEWLFDSGKVIKGMKYGFLEPVNKFFYSKYQNKVFDISLYTIDGYSKARYWITTLKNVEVLSPDEAHDILNKYKKNGWFAEMKNDLSRLNLNPETLEQWSNSGILFNIKFSAEQLTEIEGPFEIPKKNLPETSRYILLNPLPGMQNFIENETTRMFSFDDTGSDNADDLSLKASHQRNTYAAKEVTLKHSEIQKHFLQYLQSIHGKQNVKRECRAYGLARIDVVLKEDDGYVFYEIKTYNSLIASIRESIGQLLEYSFYPEIKPVNKLCIVSDVSPNETIKKYLDTLNKIINIPITYIQFDTINKTILLEHSSR